MLVSKCFLKLALSESNIGHILKYLFLLILQCLLNAIYSLIAWKTGNVCFFLFALSFFTCFALQLNHSIWAFAERENKFSQITQLPVCFLSPQTHGKYYYSFLPKPYTRHSHNRSKTDITFKNCNNISVT